MRKLWKQAVVWGLALVAATTADVTYKVWPESLRITAIDLEAHRLWFDMGVDEDMQKVMPVAYENGVQTSPVYTTIVTATEVTATEWTAVENSRVWEPNYDGMDGWSWLDDIDTESDKRFFRVSVTREQLTAGESISFGKE